MSDGTRLYLVTPPAFHPAEFAPVLEATLRAGAVACLQVRLKDAPEAVVRAAVAALKPLCHARDVALILNDRPDLAAALGCDGVHVGEHDPPVAAARKSVGGDRIVGASCYDSRHLAMEAAEAGADYVAFGTVYPSPTKESGRRAPPELIAWWAELMEVPCVAIGGITPANCPPLIAAGADFLAVSSGVWDHREGPAAAILAFAAAGVSV